MATQTRAITASEQQYLLRLTEEEAASFTIGFVRLLGDDQAELGGSGTLVSVGDKYAILTAAHVVTHLPRRGQVGLIFATANIKPELHRYILDMKAAQAVKIADNNENIEGPDLGLILLPRVEAEKLKAARQIRNFYNLSTRKDKLLSNPPDSSVGGWSISGMIDEWTTELAPERSFSRVIGFRGIFGGGVVSKYRTDNAGFDYFTFEVRHFPDYSGPVNFQGISGGGLWHFIARERKGGGVYICDSLLSGVAYYQTAIENGVDLTCHGRASVYQKAYDVLAAS